MLLKALPLIAIVLLGFVLRGARIASDQCLAVEIDGAEYCRMAEHLAAGDGLRGMLPGLVTMLPPLYPLCIATAMPLCGGDSVAAARAVSCAASLLSIVLAWLLLRRLLSPLAAFAGAMALAVAPVFVLLGSSCFAEALQLAVLLGALLALQQTLETQSIRTAALTGVLFGLAALARIESVVCCAIACVWILQPADGRSAFAARIGRALLCGGVCLLLLLPWALHLRDATGSLRLEAKSERVAATVERTALGADYGSANYAIDAEGQALGPWLRPTDAATLPQKSLSGVFLADPGKIGAYWFGNLQRTGWWLLSGRVLSSALVLLAAVFGWRALRRGESPFALLLPVLAAQVVVLGCLYKPVLRYSAPAALCFWLLAAAGTAMLCSGVRLARTLVAVEIVLLAMTCMSGFPERSNEFTEASDTAALHAGAALQTLPLPQGPILCADARVPFACARDWLPLPAAPSAAALSAYAHQCDAAALLWPLDEITRPGPFAAQVSLVLRGFHESSFAVPGWRVFLRDR